MAFASVGPFARPGRWLRGNLHGHTTESDGKLSPLEVIEWYANAGYDFTTFADHRIVTGPPESNHDLVVIPGSELEGVDPTDGAPYTVVGLGLPLLDPGDPFLADRARPLQAVVDQIRERRGQALIVDPSAFCLSSAKLGAIRGAFAIEVYDAVCDLFFGKGYSTVQWDELWNKGIHFWGVAVDDSHFFAPDHGLGWVMAKAKSAAVEDILTALESGSFYSSQGPIIEDLTLDGDRVSVDCSPARSIRFMSNGNAGWQYPDLRVSTDGELLTTAQYELKAKGGYHLAPTYVRVEIVDPEGKTAWTNPILINSA